MAQAACPGPGSKPVRKLRDIPISRSVEPEDNSYNLYSSTGTNIARMISLSMPVLLQFMPLSSYVWIVVYVTEKAEDRAERWPKHPKPLAGLRNTRTGYDAFTKQKVYDCCY